MNNTAVHTIYSGRSTNWPMVCLSVALVLPLLVLAQGSHGSWSSVGFLIPLLVVVAPGAINLLTATSLRATAGPNGITAHCGVLGWPRFRYPMHRIQHVEAIEVPRSQWVWGMYWSPRRGLMLTLRSGPALKITLTNGRKVTISTPQPQAAILAIDSARGDDFPSSDGPS
jgi:hypothetical protein